MKRTLFIIVLINIATCQVVSKTEACTCAQLLIASDCNLNYLCTWNQTKLACEVSQSTGTETTIKKYGKSLYCEGQGQNDCLNKNECAWIDNKCTFFTSCTPFQKTNKDECQAQSKRCTSDGYTCVEIDLCSTYLTSNSCYQSRTNYCFWDEITKKCSDVTECSQLPSTLTKDSECRSQLKYECTAKTGGGCLESGTNCEDQISEVGCVTNKARTVNCFWGNNKCYEKKCEFALTSNRTHDDCQKFFNKCTAKENGGCVDIKTCSDGRISEGCKIDSTGKECYWSSIENKCKDKLCINAPNTLKSNSECQKQLLPSCITNGAGCVDDISCASSIVPDQCGIDRFNNKQCIWNGTCKDKTCENAGSEIIGHEQCSTYSIKCTGKANNVAGCQNRTCENAPNTITTNSGCEEYLSNKNCITKKDGGCVTNTTCSTILIKDACFKDINGKDCYWDILGDKCLDKTCASLPSRFNTHSLCNEQINTCTVNSSGTCVDLICENIIDKDNCIKNKDGGECIYYESCYQKQCNSAPQTYITHAECQEYLKKCTLSNTKKGCMDIPLTCSALTIKENCELKSNGGRCGWNGLSCIDFTCSTAPIKTDDVYTVALCEAYKQKSNCVPNLSKKGCMELVIQCELRKIVEQCDVVGTKRNGGKTCLWDGQNCYEKTCANATRVGYANSVVVLDDKVSHDDCQNWLKDKDDNPLCIVGKSNKVCAVYPTNCNGLGENSCLPNVLKIPNTDPIQYLNCYWNTIQQLCVDGDVCANLDKSTHDGCSNASNNKCTISADGTKCVDRQVCNQYSKKIQCVKDKYDFPCKWDGNDNDTNKCINQECQQPQCEIKKNTCAEYKYRESCLGGILGNKLQCKWNEDTKSCVYASINCSEFQEQACSEQIVDGVQQCFWKGYHDFLNKGVCEDAIFDCTKVKGSGLTINYCYNLNSKCSVNKTGDSCIFGKYECEDYTLLNDCARVISTGLQTCYVQDNTCKKLFLECDEINGKDDEECQAISSICIYKGDGKCKPNASIINGTHTYDTCKEIDRKLSVKNDGTGCYYVDQNCSNLPITTCTQGLDGQCLIENSLCVAGFISDCESLIMQSQGSAKLSHWQCSYISNLKCGVYYDQSKCRNIRNQCSDYSTNNQNLNECYFQTIQYQICILNASKDTCIEYDRSTRGEINQTHEMCQFYSNQCTATNPPSNACTDYIRCKEYKGIYTFSNCYQFDIKCSVNFDNTACIEKKDYCKDYDLKQNCAYALIEGPCVWDEIQKCIQKSCSWITDLTSPSAEQCQAKQLSCNLPAEQQGEEACIKRGPCSSYTESTSCIVSNIGQKCIWNSISKKCFDRTCANADSTYVGNCTVKVGANGTTLEGCINLDACINYKVEEQCKINTQKKECVWSLAETPNKCVDKSCRSADPNQYTNFEQCQNYYKIGECTLGAKKEADGTYKEFGCMPIALCTEYYTSGQCKISKNKDDDDNFLNCYWNETTKKCGDASCAQADDTFTTHDACVSYGNAANLKCTIDRDEKGCVPIPNTCEEMSKVQCVDEDAKQNKCIWLESNGSGQCVQRTCQNAVNPTSSSDCQSHLYYCTMIDTGNKCKTKSCEDYYFTEDSACAAIFKNSKCTTNGKFCVNRGSCTIVQNQNGCTSDSSGNPCEWIVPEDPNKIAYCVLKTCTTAPKTLVSESQCLQYFTPKSGVTCNTQQGGGCIERSTCSAAKGEAACNTDANGQICAWDSETFICRNQECKDISGSTHQTCQNPSDKNLKGKCTAGKSSRCAPIQNCTSTTFQAACVVGTDGPCIWLPDYPNDDNTKGACFRYDSCKSLYWTQDSLCKYISDKCTTDGTSCIGITSCDKTNVNGGCVTGTDGTCITIVQSLGSANKSCTKYVSCTLALFKTHSECQAANPNCTTNGTTSCIELGQCAIYVKDACHFNKVGRVTNLMKQITSTGKCNWDQTINSCRDENCIDFQGATHQACSSQLITCTTDGTKCIVKDSCTQYTKNNTCTNALGTEGLCTWVQSTNTCRVKTCDDITGGTTLMACSIVNNCITDGTKCILRSTCDKYTTKIGCYSKGTDGFCIWTETKIGNTTTGKCSLMRNCASAAKDQDACQQASDRCKWTAATTTTSSSCVDHTCESFGTQSGRCLYFPSWDSSKLNICRNVNGKCTATDPKALLDTECYNLSAYMYSWNSKTNSCSQCQIVMTPNNSTIGNDLNQTDDSGYVLSLTVLIGYLLY
ncbi:unnamed protein product [Paramecium pentaurelia]|uniref:Uncharacterized protein n=1 Tax=Paramecium pentaurelia TaxID=43138 RepID=A0A8S1XY82_9CILI|nr:unnamed protein product [Paramecium pentaurelia]